MSLDKEIVKISHVLNAQVHENCREYYHSRVVATSNTGIVLPSGDKHGFEVNYDIKDLLFIGALTRNSILLTGSTDIGKTLLSKLMMNALYGREDKGWHRVDVDIDFGKDTYTDTDFSIIQKGQKISDGLYRANNFLSMPGIIWDEINRTHAKLGNKLLHAFDRDISLPDGSRVALGVPCEGSNNYQFQIAAINEGEDYKGTFDIDKALRRRTIIEVPFDIFPLTQFDRLCLKKSQKDIQLKNEESNLETILQIYKGLQNSISLHPTAELFASFIESFDYCKNSMTGEKGSVASKEGSIYHICERPVALNGTVGTKVCCEFLKSFNDNLCPHVRGITPGISKNLISVAKGFALLRAQKFASMVIDFLDQKVEPKVNARGEVVDELNYRLRNPKEFKASLQKYAGGNLDGVELARASIEKYAGNLEVEISDVESALGFVGYSKIGIAPLWVAKNYQGNRYQALKTFSTQAKAKFEEGLTAPEIADSLGRVLTGAGTAEEIKNMELYCDAENPWLWRAIAPYIQDKKTKSRGRDEIKDIYGP